MANVAIQITTQLNTEECCNCHMLFAVTADFMRRMREDGGRFYCPQGHGQSYMDTEVMKLNRELSATKNRLDIAVNNANRAQRDAEAERTKRRRIEKRVHAGVCPHCQRTFSQLARHMETKHKDAM